MKLLRVPLLWAVPLLAALLLTPAWADPINLTSGNSSVYIDPASDRGMYDWLVDGVDQLYQQWFWYRIGDTPEKSIDTLTYGGAELLGTRGVNLSYSGNGLAINVLYVLTGTPHGKSDVAETISITNTGTRPLDFHFFQYSDFDLNGTSQDQTSRFFSPAFAIQYGGGKYMTETSAIPYPGRHEMALCCSTLDKLNDSSPTNLNNTNSAGPGDAIWAFQWDRVLGAGESMIISKDKMIADVPEPFTLALVGGGLLVLGWFRRRTLG